MGICDSPNKEITYKIMIDTEETNQKEIDSKENNQTIKKYQIIEQSTKHSTYFTEEQTKIIL